MYGARPFGRPSRSPRRRFALLAAGSVAVLFFGLAASTTFHFVPPFPLFWVLPLLAIRAMGVGLAGSRPLPAGVRSGREDRERELLEALGRPGRVTATRVALETSLGVGEAEEKLSGLAERGHLRVDVHGESLAYSLWDEPLGEDSQGEIGDGAP